MTTDISAYVPLRTIVSYAIDECDKSDGDYDKFWILAFRGLLDLMYDISAEHLTVRLPVLPNKTVPFPVDCLSWSKVGILNDRGEVNTLKINTGLTTFKDNNPDRLSAIRGDINNSSPLSLSNPFYVNYYLNGYFQPLYGAGGGLIQYGECRVDEKNRIILLDINFKYDHIIFEYMSSPEKNGDYSIELYLQEALIAFIKWKAKMGTYQEYVGAKRNARARAPKKRFNLQLMNQVLRESNGMKMRS